MEFKGTKGRWKLANIDDYSAPKGGYIIDENGNVVCSLFSGAKLNGKSKSIEEIKANALLVSKAPEMFEMLKSCLLAFQQIGMEEPQGLKQLIKEATTL